MARRPPSRSGLLIITGLVFAFALLTFVVAKVPAVSAADHRLLAPPVNPMSWVGQILNMWALLTMPVVVYACLVGLALWAARRRMRNLAIALVLAVALAGGGSFVLRQLIGRARPPHMESLSISGAAFPSGHVTAMMAACVMIAAVMTVTRQPKSVRRWWSIGATALVSFVLLNRWAMSAHWITDLAGGILLGGAAAALALVIADVHVLPKQWNQLVWVESPKSSPEPTAPRCAVIFNPAKVLDWVTFRRHVEFELDERGYQRTLWLETTEEDPGLNQARTAIAAGVDLVLAAGGDGTIRIVTSQLAGTGIPFGLIPAGTGNLLARNLGIPLDETQALENALDGTETPIDLVRITVDGGPADHFAVMAGIGIDAAILEGTDAHLKKAVGSAAYFVSAAQHVNHPPMKAKIRIDDGPVIRRTALVMVVGNVGYLQAGIPLLPDARADDGLLDLLVANPRTWRDKIAVTARVLTRRDRRSTMLDRITARKVQIEIEEAENYQLDGDSVGSCRSVTFEVIPGALSLRTSQES